MLKNSIKVLVFTLSFLLIESCASKIKSSEPIWIDKFSFYSLQPVPKEMQGQSIIQMLKIATADGNHELLLQIELLSEQINMVGFSSSGLVLFQLHWRAPAEIEVETKIQIDGIDAAILLAYYQLSNWPLEMVTMGLNGMEAKLSPINDESRQYFHHHELVFSLTKDGNKTVLEHYRDKYLIEIETLEATTLSIN